MVRRTRLFSARDWDEVVPRRCGAASDHKVQNVRCFAESSHNLFTHVCVHEIAVMYCAL